MRSQFQLGFATSLIARAVAETAHSRNRHVQQYG